MNILLTSAGRRGYLVKYFKEALAGKGEVHVANSSSHSSAMRYGDHSVVTPLISFTEYIPFLLAYCQEHNIKVLLSLFDIDLPVLSMHIAKFKEIGVQVIVSSTEVNAICNDKWLSYQFLKVNEFNVPQTYLSIEAAEEALANKKINFPLIVKPRWGMGSIAVFEVDNKEELTVLYNKVKQLVQQSYLSFESNQDEEKCVIIQEKLQGQEYGLDVVNDLKGNYKGVISKEKIAMRSGETDIAKTVDDAQLNELGARLSAKLGHIANLDVDVFLVDRVPVVLEMNARFGGGYPFSHLAGVDLPKAIIQWAKGETIEEELLKAKPGIIGYKDIIVTTGC